MTRWFLTVFFTIITSGTLFAQQNIEIKGSGTNLYIEHKVAPKESLYSIGRLYNVQPKTLASFNHLALESGLNVGQDVKIPLEKENFSQSDVSTNGEALVPLYHTVQPKETLYRLGVNYNKVPLSSLKKWNHLNSDALTEGSNVIVGFLKVDKSQSALANQASKPVVQDVQVTEKPVEKEPEVVVENKPVTKEPEVSNVAVTNTETNSSEIPASTVKTKSTINFSGGYFKKLYDQQIEKKSPFYATGNAATFKSTSGWQDGKYYCFNNDAAPGTIVKITDNNSGNIVYAKVLDGIPDIKQNSGLALILSNAAAEELGVGEAKFNCVMSYVK
jgi:LysM repeat protein